MQRFMRSVWRPGAVALGATMFFSAYMPLPLGDLATSFEIGAELTASLARGPVPAAEALRDVRVAVSGQSGEMLVLFAAVIRKGRIVAVQQSQPFRAQPGQPVYDIPLFPEGWQKSGYAPGPYFLLDGQFLPGDQFLPREQSMLANEFAAEMRTGRSSAELERGARVSTRGRDALVLGLVPADPAMRPSAAVGPLFIVGKIGLGP